MLEAFRHISAENPPAQEATPIDIVRFTPIARERLVSIGYTVFPLTGRLLWEMMERDDKIVCGVQAPDTLLMDRSRATEVAIDLQQRVIGMWSVSYETDPDTIAKKGKESIKRKIGTVDLASKSPMDRAFLEEIEVSFGTPADYVDLAATHLDHSLLNVPPSGDGQMFARTSFVTLPERDGSSPEGPSFSWMAGSGREQTTRLPALVAVLGDSKGKTVIYDVPSRMTGSNLQVFPLIVPK